MGLLMMARELSFALSASSAVFREFADSVGTALFAPPHTPSEGSLGSDDEGEQRPSARASAEHRRLAPRRSGDADPSARPRPRPRPSFSHAISVGLAFPPAQEEAFTRWYAEHMWRYDAVCSWMCAVLQTVLVFVPGTAYGLFFRLPWTRWVIGYCHVILLGLLSLPKGRAWYLAHRDAALTTLTVVMLIYHHGVLENYYHLSPPAVTSCNNVAYSFLWLPFVALLFQSRFRFLGPTITACAAINSSLLWGMCEDCRTSLPARRCIGRGASKVAVIVAAALCVVYCIEWRARRLWSAQAA